MFRNILSEVDRWTSVLSYLRYSQMRSPPYFHTRHHLVLCHCLLDGVVVGLSLLDGRFQGLCEFVGQQRKDRLPDYTGDPCLNPAVALRQRGLIGDPHRVLAILLDAQRKLRPFNFL